MSFNTVGTDTAVSLNAANANGNGTAIQLSRDAVDISVFAFSTGAPTTANVTLAFSDDGGTNYYDLSPAVTLAATGTLKVVGVATVPPGSTHVRAVLSGLAGGTAPTVTAKIAHRRR